LKEIDKSIESYNRALAIKEQDWDAHRGLGVAYIFKSKKDDGTVDQDLKAKAVQQWKRSLSIKPDQPKNQRLRNLVDQYSN
jgi:hypothetical protein